MIAKKQYKSKNTLKKALILKGGKYLGQGSFGCVISPALQCNRNSKKSFKSNRRYSIPREDVSKIISRTDDEQETVDNEIEISNKLKQIDPNQKYFLYIKDNCKIHNVPRDRSNLASVRFLDEESLEIQMLDKKKLDKYHCQVDLKLEPRNLILSNGGTDLGDVLYINSKMHSSSKTKYKSDYSDKIEMTKLLYKNFKHHALSLLQGLYKLHQNNIVQRDIKIENLMIDWTSQSRSDVIVRFIDFGLSEILSPQYVSSKYNIHSHGTPELISLDITIASKIKNYYRYDKDYILNEVLRELEKGIEKTFIDFNLDTSIIKPKAIELIDRIYQYFTNGTILTKYFGNHNDKFNGYVQKSDVFALGITFYEILHKYCYANSICADLKKNPKLTHLIKNMIELDPEKRFNVLQCLQHPYFA
jgi:serine/threonine protein kinase